MGKLTAQETLCELLRAQLPGEKFQIREERNFAISSTYFIVRRMSDGMDAVLEVPDKELLQIAYPTLLAEAIAEQVLKQFSEVPYEVPQVDG